MMRLGRRASLLVAFGLLTSAATHIDPARNEAIASRMLIPRKIKALPLLLAERATDRATERERKAQRYGRANERAQRSPPDKTAKTPSASLVGDRPTSWALTG